MISDRLNEQVDETMKIVANYVDEMMGKLIDVVKGSKLDTFTNELPLHLLETNRDTQVSRLKS